MRKTFLTILSLLTFIIGYAQSDSSNIELPKIPNSEYAIFKYDSILQTNILTYQYSDICDLDNDGIKDTLSFISNGAVHTYFYLHLKLSLNKHQLDFRTFQIDMPYLSENRKISEMTQFCILDYDKDGVDEIFLNIDNTFGSIPEKLKTNGLTSKQMIIEFENGKLVLKNYAEK